MGQKIFSKFNIYDQIGYLMVGAVALFVLIFNTYYFFNQSIPDVQLEYLLVWLVLAYFAGHLVQAIANLISDIPFLRRLIREEKSEFNEREKEILKEAKKYFELEKQNNNSLWSHCYMLASAKDITGQVQSFNAYYSLYRGWLVIFFLESLFLLGYLVMDFCWQKVFLFLVSTFFIVIFYRRSKRFWNYTRNKVLETFVIIKTLNL